MAYKPILFNTEMVKAILGWSKTQTRRVCKGYGDVNPIQCGYHPPCEPGDILWVRETWCDPEPDNYMVPVFYKADMPLHWDAEDTAHGEAVDITADEFKWRPSIHMPKEAARIFLRVKNVRVERLQDITLMDAMAEGFYGAICKHIDANPELGCTDCYNTGWLERPDHEFAQLWDTTIKPADIPEHGWDANPWVWVIEFERCEKPKEW